MLSAVALDIRGTYRRRPNPSDSEEELKTLLIRAELTGFSCHESIDLGKPLGTARPDFFFPVGTGHGRGICIYLDDLSRALHGKPETAARDREIRDEMRAQLYAVVGIPASHLSEQVAMRHHLMQIGGLLNGREAAERIQHADFWSESGTCEKCAKSLCDWPDWN